MLKRNPIVPGGRSLIEVYILLLHQMQGEQIQVFPIYLSTLTHSLNVAIFPVACPLVMSKFFGSISEVDSHKKSSHYDLELENFLVT